MPRRSRAATAPPARRSPAGVQPRGTMPTTRHAAAATAEEATAEVEADAAVPVAAVHTIDGAVVEASGVLSVAALSDC